MVKNIVQEKERKLNRVKSEDETVYRIYNTCTFLSLQMIFNSFAQLLVFVTNYNNISYHSKRHRYI